jgi:hypothetical protein
VVRLTAALVVLAKFFKRLCSMIPHGPVRNKLVTAASSELLDSILWGLSVR